MCIRDRYYPLIQRFCIELCMSNLLWYLPPLQGNLIQGCQFAIGISSMAAKVTQRIESEQTSVRFDPLPIYG